MSYVVFIRAPLTVTLGAAAFSEGEGAARTWEPAARCRDVLGAMAHRLDEVVEVASTAYTGGAAVLAAAAAAAAAAADKTDGKAEGCGPEDVPEGMTQEASMMFTVRVRGEVAVEALLDALAMQCGIGNDDTPACGTVTVLSVELARPLRPRIEGVGGGGGGRGRGRAESFTSGNASGSGVNSEADGGAGASSARVLADRVLLRIVAGAAINFDYVVLVCVASGLAGIGLATNSAVMIVAAMLVSPLMGPVMGLTFGTFVRDGALMGRSLASEALGLVLALASGLLVGILCVPLDTTAVLPTPEMTNRGEPAGLGFGVAVALLSGAGVALSITGDNAASLVGVAISASLLPPVVNAGMCWCLAAACRTGWRPANACAADFATLGGYSLALTFVNIVGILIAAVVMFWIKEVAPRRSRGTIFDAMAYVSTRYASPEPWPEDLPLPPQMASATDRVGRPTSASRAPGSVATRAAGSAGGGMVATAAATAAAVFKPGNTLGPTFAALAAGPLGVDTHTTGVSGVGGGGSGGGPMALSEAVTLMKAQAAAARPVSALAMRAHLRAPAHARIRPSRSPAPRRRVGVGAAGATAEGVGVTGTGTGSGGGTAPSLPPVAEEGRRPAEAAP